MNDLAERGVGENRRVAISGQTKGQSCLALCSDSTQMRLWDSEKEQGVMETHSLLFVPGTAAYYYHITLPRLLQRAELQEAEATWWWWWSSWSLLVLQTENSHGTN